MTDPNVERMERDMRAYDRARGRRPDVEARREPDDWAFLGGVLLKTAALLSVLGLVGVLQQRWIVHYDEKRAQRSAAAGEDWAAGAEEVAERMTGEAERLRARLERFTPQEKALYREFVDQFTPVLVANPHLLALSRAQPPGSGQAGRFRRAQVKLAMQAWVALAWLATHVVLGLWLACAAAAGLGACALWGERKELGAKTLRAMLVGGWLWFWALSLLCAYIFMITGRNLWPQLPWSFFLAPAAAYGVLAACGLDEPERKTWVKAVEAYLAPLCCAAVVWLGAFFV